MSSTFIKWGLGVPVAIGAMLSSSIAFAAPITGSLALGGSFEFTDPAGGAINDSPLSMNFSTLFGGDDTILVSSASSGDFASLAGTYGSISTLELDPTVSSPANACLNCPLTPFYTVGSFSFDLETLVVNLLTDTDVSLYGTGLMSTTDPSLDAVQADWALTGDIFSGLIFTWSSTSNPVAVSVPEPGVAAMLTFGLLGLGFSRRGTAKA